MSSMSQSKVLAGCVAMWRFTRSLPDTCLGVATEKASSNPTGPDPIRSGVATHIFSFIRVLFNQPKNGPRLFPTSNGF